MHRSKALHVELRETNLNVLVSLLSFSIGKHWNAWYLDAGIPTGLKTMTISSSDWNQKTVKGAEGPGQFCNKQAQYVFLRRYNRLEIKFMKGCGF